MIYLDHAATSPLRPPVWQAMQDLLGEADFNPASAHSAGGRAAEALQVARSSLADTLGGSRTGVILTGGGTLSDNLAVLGFARANSGGVRILVSAIEHKAVLESAARARSEGAEVHVLPVDRTGTVRMDHAKRLLEAADAPPTLLSVMWANNETGTVQPVEELCAAAHAHGALFHTDAVQAFGKLAVSLETVPADLLTLTAHKLGGPVGIGLLYRAEGVELEPLAYGGAQEGGLWPGTQNPLGACGFATAARLAVDEIAQTTIRWRGLREDLEAGLRTSIPDLHVHAGEAPARLPHVLSVGIPGCDQAVLLTALDMEGVAVSAGSACNSGAHTGSHVLDAMGVTPEGAYAVLRFSFAASTTEADVAAALDRVTRLVEQTRIAS
jgi:cysteine desulfurase